MSWRWMLRVAYAKGGGPFTTRELEDAMNGCELRRAVSNSAVTLGVIDDLFPGHHGAIRSKRWVVTQFGRDVVEGRVYVHSSKGHGIGKSLLKRSTWLMALPRENQVRLDELPLYKVSTGFEMSGYDSDSDNRQLDLFQTAILSPEIVNVVTTVLPCMLDLQIETEDLSVGDYPCLLAQTKLKPPSRSTDANHPWKRQKVELPRP